MDGTDARAGVAKLGTSENVILPVEERIARAVGRVQAETGCPVADAHDARDDGARAARPAGGGRCRPHEGCAEPHGPEPRLRAPARALRAGRLRPLRRPVEGEVRIRRGEDRHAAAPRRGGPCRAAARLGRHGTPLVPTGATAAVPGSSYILGTFVPRLRRAGLDDALVEQIFVQSPARWLDS